MRTLKLSSVALVLLGLLSAGPAHAFEFKPYGFLKADLAVDMGNPNSGGNWVRWVDPKPDERPTSVSIHARQSRLGFDLIGSNIKDVAVMGRIETDFTNGGAEYTYNLKLRKAFLKVSTPNHELLAGQESDIHSPLVPSTVNYLVAWWAGNIGFRRPQFRYTYRRNMSETSGIEMALGVMRSISTSLPADNYDVPLPVFAGRLAYRMGGMTLGVSGHYGQERERVDANAIDEVIDTYSANLDLSLKLSDSLSISGEFWYGTNLDTFLGGIGQGVVLKPGEGGAAPTLEALVAMGGWAQVSFASGERFRLNLGGSADMPSESDLEVGARSRNLSGFLNVQYMAAKDVWVAVEGSYFRTDYKEAEGADSTDSDDIRGQLAFIYNFK